MPNDKQSGKPKLKVVRDPELSYELPPSFNSPRMTMANEEINKELAPIPQPPSVIQQILAVGKIIVLVLAAAASSLVAAAAGGASIPPALLGVATAVVAIAASLGLVSPGVKALEAPKK
jgi:hypothetical protein